METNPHAEAGASAPPSRAGEFAPVSALNSAPSEPAGDSTRGELDAIRAVLAMKPAIKRSVTPAMWFVIAFFVLLAAVVAWQWTAKAHSTQIIAPPQIDQPKPPDFALDTPGPALQNNAAPSPAPRHRRTRHSGN